MLKIELQLHSIKAHTKGLQQLMSQGLAAPYSAAALQGQAHIQRALNTSAMPASVRQQLAADARRLREQASTRGVSHTEALLHEQVYLICSIVTGSLAPCNCCDAA